MRNNISYKQIRPLQVFPPPRPLDFIATDILRPLPGTTNRNKQIFEITDRYPKLVRAVTTKKRQPRTLQMFSLIIGLFHMAFQRISWLTTTHNLSAIFCSHLHVHWSQTLDYQCWPSPNKREGKAFHQNDSEIPMLLHSGVSKKLGYLCPATHVCMQHTGSSLSQHRATQPRFKQALTGTNTTCFWASTLHLCFRRLINSSDASRDESSHPSFAIKGRHAHVCQSTTTQTPLRQASTRHYSLYIT